MTMAMISIKNCSLLLASTDSYVHEAEITASQINKLGISALMPCYALFNSVKPVLPKEFTVLYPAEKGTWSSEIHDALMQIRSEYVFLWMDDCVPLELIDMERVIHAIEWLISTGGDYLRLNPLPPAAGETVVEGIRRIIPGELYRTSTVFSIWRRDVFLSLLARDETAWEFEDAGSIRSDIYNNFYSMTQSNVFYENLVVKGMLNPFSLAIVRSAGVNTDSLLRPVMNTRDLLWFYFLAIRSKILRLFPATCRRPIRALFTKYL